MLSHKIPSYAGQQIGPGVDGLTTFGRARNVSRKQSRSPLLPNQNRSANGNRADKKQKRRTARSTLNVSVRRPMTRRIANALFVQGPMRGRQSQQSSAWPPWLPNATSGAAIPGLFGVLLLHWTVLAIIRLRVYALGCGRTKIFKLRKFGRGSIPGNYSTGNANCTLVRCVRGPRVTRTCSTPLRAVLHRREIIFAYPRASPQEPCDCD